MKQFLNTHDTFIDDLRDAAKVAEKHNRQSLADSLQRYADELRDFDNRTGWTDPFDKDNLFILECCESRSYFKKWQMACLCLAEKHEGSIFTLSTIEDLRRLLNEEAAKYRGSEEIQPVDWRFVKEYHVRPALAIGYGCQINFRPVRGYYLMNDKNAEK